MLTWKDVFRDLLAKFQHEPASFDFIKPALDTLELACGEIALLALQGWASLELDHPAIDLFEPVAALRNPSWGNYARLLDTLNTLHRRLLAGEVTVARGPKEAPTLVTALEFWEALLPEGIHPAARNLAALAGTADKSPPRPKVKWLFALLVRLRNAIAHVHVNTEAATWKSSAASTLADGLVYLAVDELAERILESPDRRKPWFLLRDGSVQMLRGVSDRLVPRYTGRDLASIDGGPGSVAPALCRLFGKSAEETHLGKLLAELAPEPVAGFLLDEKYLVGAPLHDGATVHRATQLDTGRLVAIKLLKVRDGLDDEEAKLRFEREARYLGVVAESPHVVSVLDTGNATWRESPQVDLSKQKWFTDFVSTSAPIRSYIAMEWVHGETLDHWIQSPTPPRPQIITNWFCQAAKGLVSIHDHKLIHRDVKPSNIMVIPEPAPGLVKVMDLGIARNIEQNQTLTAGFIGTPAYAAPEQLTAATAELAVTEKADVYSLCQTFYELYTGARLFGHDHDPAYATGAKLSGKPPPRTSSRVRGVERELDTLLRGGLQREPADRPSMRMLADDLRRILEDKPIQWKPPGPLRRARLFYRRHRTGVSAAVVLLIALLCSASIYVYKSREAQRYLVGTLQEQGRQELERGRPDRALPYLSEAYSRGGKSAALRLMLADAMRTVDAERLKLAGHKGGTWAADFSPDGTRLASGGQDGTVKLWDTVTGALLRTLNDDSGHAHSRPVTDIRFSHDGSRIMSAARLPSSRAPPIGHAVVLPPFRAPEEPEAELIVWDAQSGRPLSGWLTWSGWDFSPDGTKVVIATPAGTVGIYDTMTEGLLGLIDRQVPGDRIANESRDIFFAPDGERVLLCGPKENIEIWSVRESRRQVSIVPEPIASFHCIGFSPKGDLVLAARDDRIHGWDAATGHEAFATHPVSDSFVSAAFSADGATAVATFGHGTVLRVDNIRTPVPKPNLFLDSMDRFAGRDDVIRRPEAATSSDVYQVRFGRLSTDRFAVEDNHFVRIESLLSGEIARIPAGGFAMAPDGLQIAQRGWTVRLHSAKGTLVSQAKADKGFCSRMRCEVIRPIILRAEIIVAVLKASHWVQGYLPDEPLQIEEEEWGVGIWNANTGAMIHLIPSSGPIWSLDASPDGTHFATASESGLQIWDSATAALDARSRATRISFVAFGPGGFVLTGRADGADLWRPDMTAIHQTFVTPGSRPTKGGFSGDGTRIVLVGDDAVARTWDVASGRQLRSFDSVGNGHLAALDQDGGRLAIERSRYGRIEVRDVKTGVLLNHLDEDEEWVDCLASSPAGGLFATSSTGETKLWGPNGELISSRSGYAPSFSPDGTRMATHTREGITVWDVHLEARTPSQIAAIANSRGSWRLDDGRLVPAPSQQVTP